VEEMLGFVLGDDVSRTRREEKGRERKGKVIGVSFLM
jgi:hypothetical protein